MDCANRKPQRKICAGICMICKKSLEFTPQEAYNFGVYKIDLLR